MAKNSPDIEIPVPDFGSGQNWDMNLTPPSTPKIVLNHKRTNSAGNTPPSSPYRHNLVGSDKKSLKVLLSLMKNLETMSEKLYSFCEHHFNERLTSLAIDQLKRNLNNFKDLHTLIVSQKMVVESRANDSTPSPVHFSINSSPIFIDEEWPNSLSEDWIAAAEQILKGPSDVPSSPTKSIPLEERLFSAEQKRRRLENIKRLEIRKQTNRVRRVVERRKQQTIEAETAIRSKLDEADQRREAIITQKVEKARSETEKAQETKYLIDLENEDRKAQLERKSDETARRHEEMVRQAQEKARERALLRSPPHPAVRKRSVSITKGTLSLLEALRSGRLPGDLSDERSSNSSKEDLLDSPSKQTCDVIADDGIPPPVLQEPPSKPTPAMVALAEKLEMKADQQHANRLMKLAIDLKINISSDSRCGIALRNSIAELLRTNTPGTDILLRQVMQLLDRSFPFAFRVGVEAVDEYRALLSTREPLKCIKELIALWTKLLEASRSADARLFLASALSRSVAIDSLCFALSAVSGDDLLVDVVGHLIVAVLGLLRALSPLFGSAVSADESFAECIEKAVGPSLVTFLTVLAMSPVAMQNDFARDTARILSALVVAQPTAVAVDESTAAAINGVLRAFLNKDATSPAARELVVLYGLLCRSSPTLRESSKWMPEPTILSLLCTMPLGFFIKKEDAAILIPTIAACCAGAPDNAEFVKGAINGGLIARFLENATETNDLTSCHLRVPKEDAAELIKLFKATKQ